MEGQGDEDVADPDDGGSSSSSSEESEDTKLLREAAHAKRTARLERWEEAGRQLTTLGHAILDDFLGAERIAALRSDVLALYRSADNPFVQGRTGGGGDGTGRKYSEEAVRGDQIAVIDDGDLHRVPGLRALLQQADQFVKALAANSAPELRRIVSRSKPMLACYPAGARYIKHVDNRGGNRRLLTLLVYFNESWGGADGGQLRMHHADGSTTDVEPLLDRLLVFWSDERTPHEVLPAVRDRWACSVWYHHDEDDGDDGGGNDMTSYGFGRTVEEIRDFLFALAALNEQDAAAKAASAGASEDRSE